MKTSRVIALATLLSLVGLSVPAVASAEDAAVLPITAIAPAVGTTVTTPFVKFAWTGQPDALNAQVIINTSSKTVDGQLPMDGKAFVSYATVEGGKASYKLDTPLSPGTYYWQASQQVGPELQNALSPVTKFIVPTSFTLTKLKAKVASNPANNLHQVEVTGKLKCNTPYGTKNRHTLTIQVFKGSKKLGQQVRDSGDCNGETSVKQFANWQPQPGSIKKGTKLTVKVFASFGKAKSDVETLKLTWK